MQMMKIVKTALSTISSVGAGAIVGNIVCATMPAGTGFLMKACINIGSYALANAVGKVASDQIEKEIDEVVDLVKQSVKDETKETGSN